MADSVKEARSFVYDFGEGINGNLTLSIESRELPAQRTEGLPNPATNVYWISLEIGGNRYRVGQERCGETIPDDINSKYEGLFETLTKGSREPGSGPLSIIIGSVGLDGADLARIGNSH